MSVVVLSIGVLTSHCHTPSLTHPHSHTPSLISTTFMHPHKLHSPHLSLHTLPSGFLFTITPHSAHPNTTRSPSDRDRTRFTHPHSSSLTPHSPRVHTNPPPTNTHTFSYTRPSTHTFTLSGEHLSETPSQISPVKNSQLLYFQCSQSSGPRLIVSILLTPCTSKLPLLTVFVVDVTSRLLLRHPLSAACSCTE